MTPLERMLVVLAHGRDLFRSFPYTLPDQLPFLQHNRLASGVICGLIGTLSVIQPDGLRIGLLSEGPLIGLASLFLVALLSGGLACLRHFALRLLLWQAGSIPWNYPRFLGEANRRIQLYKEGPGHRFTHRLLQDYFADLDLSSLSSSPSPTASLLGSPSEGGK